MKQTKVKIDGKTFTLRFTMGAFYDLSERIEGFNLAEITKYVKTISQDTVTLLYVLANEGAEGKLDVDRAWFLHHLPMRTPALNKLKIAIFDALANGMKMEEDGDDDDVEVDVVLEELKKKDKTDD